MIAEMMLGTVLASAAGGAAYLVLLQKREKEHRERELLTLRTQFRDSLIQTLRTRGASCDFRFSDYAERCDIPRDIADEIADELYLQLCQKVVADGVVTDDERRKLTTLARFLDVDPVRANGLELHAKVDAYRGAVTGALADGVVTATEAAELESLRASLGVEREHAVEITDDLSRDAYLSLLTRVASRGQITPQAKSEVECLKKALALRDEDLKALIRDEAMEVYRRLFAFVAQDGVITSEEEESLDWLQHEAGIPDSLVWPCKQRIVDVRCRSDYREGRLPTVATRLILHSGEICHWQEGCLFQYCTPSGNPRQESGTLMVTSKNLTFNSSSKTFSFSPSKILDISLSADGVVLKTSVRNGNGYYKVGNPADLEAILIGLTRKHKYLLAESFSSSYSRHIPHVVKTEVWSRDGGRCVYCRADDYLEFDHIIPHEKGGANTVGNVQLLCRRCNNEKRDRI